MEFLLEGNLWQHCSKPERERFKQEILLRPALDVQAKKELCGKLGIDISAEELQYRISRTSTQDEHKRQVSLPILIYACRAWGMGDTGVPQTTLTAVHPHQAAWKAREVQCI